MSNEGLCVVDYVVMLLLDKFKGKTGIERLDSYLNRNASEDVKAIIHCTGGLRGFLVSQSESFIVDGTSVSCNDTRKPSKESDVIKWFRGRLRTSPRRIFSYQALRRIVKNGPSGINNYFSFTCPNHEKLEEWFLQRTQIFKETPSGNIALCDCQISPSEDNGLWSCIDFFVKILDEQGCDTLAVDFSCLFNYVFITENPIILGHITSMYDEATFENFFKSNAIQFGLELKDGQLCRSWDPANSGMEIAPAAPSDPSPMQRDDSLALCVEYCRDILTDKCSISLLELKESFYKLASRTMRESLERKFTDKPFEKFVAENENIFVLSQDGRSVSLKDGSQSSEEPAETIDESAKNPKYEKLLRGLYHDLLTAAAQEQGLQFVSVQHLVNCVHFLPKYVGSYIAQAYSTPLQFLRTNDTLRYNRNQKVISLQDKIEAHGVRFGPEAIATHSLNFFVKAFVVLHSCGVAFIPQTQLDLLSCFLHTSSRIFIDVNFGAHKIPIRHFLLRFPEHFSESRAGNIFLRNPKISDCPFAVSKEILTHAKAVCTYPTEAAAVEFYLQALLEISSQCYPVPLWWCSAKLKDAPTHVISFLEELHPDRNLTEFFDKFPAIFCSVPEIAAVYLLVGPLTEGYAIPAARNNDIRIEDEHIVLGLIAALSSARCAPISMSYLFEKAEKHFIKPEIEAVIAERSGQNAQAKLGAVLEKFSEVVSVNGETISLGWPRDLKDQLESVLEQTLSQIIRNTVIYLADKTGLFPAISTVYDHLLRSLDNCFSSFASTLPDFLEFLDKFDQVFSVNGSTNTIIVKDYSVQVSYSADIFQAVENRSHPPGDFSAAPASNSTFAASGRAGIQSWIDERKKISVTWTALAPLVDRFVRQMDLDSVTKFSAVGALWDGLGIVLSEIERLMRLNATDSALQWMNSYWEKNTVFFSELLPTVDKVSGFIVKDIKCFSPICGCQKVAECRTFEDFVGFCSSIQLHLEQGPLTGVLTPSSSTKSKASTPQEFDRLNQWGESEAQPLSLMIQDKTMQQVEERLLNIPDFELWGLNVPTCDASSCWPKSIWEPKPGEIESEFGDGASRIFHVTSVNLESVTAEEKSGTGGKLTMDWPNGTVQVGDEITVSVRSKR